MPGMAEPEREEDIVLEHEGEIIPDVEPADPPAMAGVEYQDIDVADAVLRFPDEELRKVADLGEVPDLWGLERELLLLEREAVALARLSSSSAPSAPAVSAPYIGETGMSSLLARISALEKKVGPPQVVHVDDPRSVQTSNTSLMRQMLRLLERIEMMSNQSAEKERMTAVERFLNASAEQFEKGKVEDKDKDKAVPRGLEDKAAPETLKALRALEERFDFPVEELPGLVPPLAGRLLTLRELHDDTARVREEARGAAQCAVAADECLQDILNTCSRLRSEVEEDRARSASSEKHLASRTARLERALALLDSSS